MSAAAPAASSLSLSSAMPPNVSDAHKLKRKEEKKDKQRKVVPQFYSRRCDYAVIPIDTRYTEPRNYRHPQFVALDHQEVEYGWAASHRTKVIEYEEEVKRDDYDEDDPPRDPHTYLCPAAVWHNYDRPMYNGEIDCDSIDSNSEEDAEEEEDDELEWWCKIDGADHDCAPDSDEDEEEDTQGSIVVDYHDLEVEIMPRLKRVTKLSSDMCEIVCSYLDPDADFGLLLEDIALLVVRTLDTIDEYREQSKKYFNEFLPSPSKEALKENLPEETKKEMLEIEEEQKKLKDEAKEQKEQNEQKKEDHEKMDESFSSDDEVIGSHYSYPVRLYLCSDSRQYLRELESILNLTLAPRMSISIIMDAVRKCIKNDTTNETLSRQRLMLMYDWFQRDYDGWEECLTQFEHRIAVIEEEWHFASDVLMVCGYLLDSRPSSNFFREHPPYRVRHTHTSADYHGPSPPWLGYSSSPPTFGKEPHTRVNFRVLNNRKCKIPISQNWLLMDFKILIEELTSIPVAEQKLDYVWKNGAAIQQEREEEEGKEEAEEDAEDTESKNDEPSEQPLTITFPLTDDNKSIISHFPASLLEHNVDWNDVIILHSNVKRFNFERDYVFEERWWRWKEKRVEDQHIKQSEAWQIEPIDTEEEQESSELRGSTISDAHQSLVDEFTRLELLYPAPIIPLSATANAVSAPSPYQPQSSQQSNSLPLSQQSHVSVLSRVSYALEQRLHLDDGKSENLDLKHVDPEVNQAAATLTRVWKWIHAVQPWSIEKDEERILERPMFATIAPLIRDLKSAIASPCYAYDANPTLSKSTSTVSHNKSTESVAAASSISSFVSSMEIDDGTSSAAATIDETRLVQPRKKIKLDNDDTALSAIGASSSLSTSSTSSSTSSSSLSIYTGELCIFRRLQTREKYAAAEKLLSQMSRVFHLQPWLGMNDTAYLSELTEVTESLRRTMAQYYLTHMTRSESLDDEIRGINQQLSAAAETRDDVSHDAIFDRHDFSLLVHEVGQDYWIYKNNLNFTPAAMQVLQEAAETELVKYFRLAKRVREGNRAADVMDDRLMLSERLISPPLRSVELMQATQIDEKVCAEYLAKH